MKLSPHAAILLLAATLTASPPPAEQPAPDQITQLAPFRVHDDAINAFGFDLAIYWDKSTRKVTRVFIGTIQEGSSATALDVRPGDEIRKIDGRPVTEFDAGIGAGTEIGRLFLNRRPGAKLDLEIIRHRAATITVVAGPVREY